MRFQSFFAIAAFAAVSLISGCAATAGLPSDSTTSGQVAAGSWAWKYIAYDTMTGSNNGPGRFELSGSPGSYRARLVLPGPGTCAVASSSAVVDSTADALVVTTTPTIKDCGVRRYTIRKDGSGGYFEVQSVTKAGTFWVRDEFDRGLTPL